MKKRQGFVSNSSSSSFIVPIDIIKDIPENFTVTTYGGEQTYCSTEIKEELSYAIKGWKSYSKKEKEEEIKSTLEGLVYHLLYNLENVVKVKELGLESNCGHVEFDKNDNAIFLDETQYFEKHNKGKFVLNENEIKEFTEYYVKEYKSKTEEHIYISVYEFPIVNKILDRWLKLVDYKKIFIVKYSDNDGTLFSDYEHYIMPSLSEIRDIVTISNH